LRLAVARPTAIYGPGDLRLLKLFRLVAGQRPMIGSGRMFYHMVHVSDLVSGLRLLAERPEAIGQVYVLGGDGYRSLNDVAALIARVLDVPPPRWHLPAWPFQLAGSACEWVCRPFGVSPPLHRRRVDFFTKSRAFSIDKAREDLGYRPQVDLEHGIRETAVWYREHGYL
jgi:dihydroflavonol-4-reductase